MRPVRVNLGSGDYPADGWFNVDCGSPHRRDVTADLTRPLPFRDRSVTDVYAGHVFEHLTLDELSCLLGELLRVTAPNAQLMVVGPDVVRARAMHARGELDDEWLRLVVEGGDRWPGDRHQWESEPNFLAGFLAAGGWRMAREVPLLSVSQIDWPVVAYDEWQCAVTAYA